MTEPHASQIAGWTEADRLSALDRYQILDTPREAEFDDIVRIAAQICGAPMALISLVDDRRQWFKAAIGLSVSETPRGIAFCAHAIEEDSIFVVRDALKDERFAANPLVTGDPGLRFYAGAPLQTPEGFPLGTLCVLDRKARDLTTAQLESLSALSRQVMAQFELRHALKQRTEAWAHTDRLLKEKEVILAEKNAALEEKDLLMQEVHHRVKNSLATVQSLLTLQARATNDPEAARQLQESAARIQTFGAIHEHLYRVGADSQVDIAAYLRSLIDDQQFAFRTTFDRRIIDFEAPSTSWPSGDAPMLGLILIELVTNALKYGAGIVRVTLERMTDEVRLIVEDEGQTLDPDFDPATSKGLGMRIIAGLLRSQKGGRLEIDRTVGHTRFIATFGLPEP